MMANISELYEIQARLTSNLPKRQRDSFVAKINWENRLISISGARGTGKTTLLLQQLNQWDPTGKTCLYISADHIQVQSIGLYEIASDFFKLGGKTLIVDEIHKYSNWSREIKNLYDGFPENHIYLSGSSALALQSGKADLSRRAIFHQMPVLSFREYLQFINHHHFPPVSLDDILQHHMELAADLLKAGPVLGHFKDYLNHGIYPYFLEGIEEYFLRLLNVLEKVFYEDIPTSIGVKTSNVTLLKQILWLIATSQPFSPNIEKMSRDLKISKAYIYTYLDALERAGLILNLFPAETGYRLVRKAAKIYIENTNLLMAIAGKAGAQAMTGTIRETFFANQLSSAGISLSIPVKGDFIAGNRFVFEIGGRSKDFSQITKSTDNFVVQDDIEVGFAHTIPLWLFGLLY